MDISRLCRSCMREVASWEKDNFNNSTVEMFCFSTNIKITDNEKLPRQFCYDCVIKIESCYTFIKEAQNVNITLKNIASRSETSIIIEPETFKSIEPETNKLRLTLPEYKLSIGITSFNNTNNFNNAACNLSSIKDISSDNVHTVTKNCKPLNEIVNKDDSNQKISKEIGDENSIEVEETKKIICPACRKSFVSQKWFTKHMEKEHSGHKYICDRCPKSFTKPYQLAYHATSHSEERKFVCNTCGKRFKHHKQLKIHNRGHSDVRPFACDKCSMRFKNKSVLKCHMKVHEEVKQYLCSYCGWGFSQAHNLEVHLRTHTGAKPHACSQCSFRSAAASSLRRHLRRHSGARPHVCAHCRKAFHDASGLTRHTRTHTGELPYKCPGCARTFADSWKRKTHLMRAHRVALHDIPRMRTDGTCAGS
ncbi:zinc finger protein 771-like [Vanessa atalanta]|uniref:zinc finger protein 771-like n=1 Tax=Vanessa atalanta TaxID=42275 RepID=UPI001FCCEA25|nr:zinc finger protein 771-like [Vanessa atalanta]